MINNEFRHYHHIFLAGLRKPKTPPSGQPLFQQIFHSGTSEHTQQSVTARTT